MGDACWHGFSLGRPGWALLVVPWLRCTGAACGATGCGGDDVAPPVAGMRGDGALARLTSEYTVRGAVVLRVGASGGARGRAGHGVPRRAGSAEVARLGMLAPGRKPGRLRSREGGVQARGGVRERPARGLLSGRAAVAAGEGGNQWSRLRSARRSPMRKARCALS